MENQQQQNVSNPPRGIREGSTSDKAILWYGDDKSPVFINLSNATKIRMEGSIIKVYHGREFVDIDCQSAERSKFLMGNIVQHLLETSRVLSQPREMTQEEKDAFKKVALSNGAAEVSPSPEVSGIDVSALEGKVQGGGATEGGKAGQDSTGSTETYHESSKELSEEKKG